MQCEGYHRKRKVAKALAACNLLKQLQGKPSRKVQVHMSHYYLVTIVSFIHHCVEIQPHVQGFNE